MTNQPTTRIKPLHIRIADLKRDSNSQAAHDLFGAELGHNRADKIAYLWDLTYDHRSNLDRLYGRGSTKTEKFTRRAEAEGFTAGEIRAFLTL